MTEISYQRGAFIAYDTDEYPNGPRRAIPFRFNPETLSRQFQIEQGRTGSGTEGARPGRGRNGRNADAASGAVKQSFSVQVHFSNTARSTARVDRTSLARTVAGRSGWGRWPRGALNALSPHRCISKPIVRVIRWRCQDGPRGG